MPAAVKQVKNTAENLIMGKLIIDGNKVYTVDEACMRRKNLTLAQIRQKEAGGYREPEEEQGRRRRRQPGI